MFGITVCPLLAYTVCLAKRENMTFRKKTFWLSFMQNAIISLPNIFPPKISENGSNTFFVFIL